VSHEKPKGSIVSAARARLRVRVALRVLFAASASGGVAQERTRANAIFQEKKMKKK
jgi:hypothetical protein